MNDLWSALKQSECTYVKSPRDASGFKAIRQNVKVAQWQFDRSRKKTKRAHFRKQVLDIETTNTEDPQAFWDFVKNLTPRKKQEIPCEVVIEGEVTSDPTLVLNHWTQEFKSLLTPPDT